MKSLYIRKLDSLNFILAEKLDEPMVRTIGGKEIVYTYKNRELFYGNIYGALIGLAKHTKAKIDTSKIDLSLKKVRPSSSEKEYMMFLDESDTQIWTKLGLCE